MTTIRAASARLAPSATLAACAFLAGCGPRPPEVGLPPGVERLPGDVVFVLHGPSADALAATPDPGDPDPPRVAAALAELLPAGLRTDVPGFAFATAAGVATGWADLGASRAFHAAWAARPAAVDTAGASWAYVDLQLLVDVATDRIADRRILALLEPLSLRSLEWAIAALPAPRADGLALDVLVRLGGGADVGIGPVLGGAAAPSLLGEPSPGERLRVELRADAVAALRTVDAWLAAEQQGSAFSVSDAMTSMVGQTWRALLAQIDGRLSAVLDGDGRWTVAVGLREPDDARDALDRFLTPDGHDVWRTAGGLRATVDGARLVLAEDGAPPPPLAGGPVIDAALRVAFDATSAAALFGERTSGVLEAGRDGPARLRVRMWRSD